MQLNNCTNAYLQKAIALVRTTENFPTEAKALSSLGQLFTKNQPELAIVFQTQLKATSQKLYNWLFNL
ncbi:MAG: hypothetical protein WBG73_04355 [Coleofasciculaceae cyanobacterium]